MNPPQIIRTPGGEELVVLHRAEYEALLARAEDADDVATYDARKAELVAGGAVLPSEESARRLARLGGSEPKLNAPLRRRGS